MRLLEVCECNLLDHVQPLGTEGHAARRLNKVIMNQKNLGGRVAGRVAGMGGSTEPVRWNPPSSDPSSGGFQRTVSLEPPFLPPFQRGFLRSRSLSH